MAEKGRGISDATWGCLQMLVVSITGIIAITYLLVMEYGVSEVVQMLNICE